MNKLQKTAPLRWKCPLSLNIMTLNPVYQKIIVKFIRDNNGISYIRDKLSLFFTITYLGYAKVKWRVRFEDPWTITTWIDETLASWLLLKHRQRAPAPEPFNVWLPLSGMFFLPVTTYNNLPLYFFRSLYKCYLNGKSSLNMSHKTAPSFFLALIPSHIIYSLICVSLPVLEGKLWE